MFSLDSVEQHRAFGIETFAEPLPYLFVPDPALTIARRYGVLRETEHPHGGFWNRSVWIINREGIITQRLLPWNVSTQNGQVSERQIAEYQRLFTLLGSEPGEYLALCSTESPHQPQRDKREDGAA